ncbi:hypothetical protein C0995_008952 [Termitomyces sp. Mi166|nr:hypothetical protein C0995_008952 [Termitomyces sp. Mi166\
MAERCAYLEAENRAFAGVGEPPDYNQSLEEGAFDEWSASVVSGAAAFVPPRRDAPPNSCFQMILSNSVTSRITIQQPLSHKLHAPILSRMNLAHLETSIKVDPSQPKPRAPIVSILSSLIFFSSNLELSISENTA